jgi:hypothetical protein
MDCSLASLAEEDLLDEILAPVILEDLNFELIGSATKFIYEYGNRK